jgi:hypothetical protein
LTYDWINRNATLNTTTTTNQAIESSIPSVNVLSSVQKQIDILIENKIELKASAFLYSTNGICLNKIDIEGANTRILLNNTYKGIYFLKVINGNHFHTYKIML